MRKSFFVIFRVAQLVDNGNLESRPRKPIAQNRFAEITDDLLVPRTLRYFHGIHGYISLTVWLSGVARRRVACPLQAT
jgi:hypothetical protein